MKVVSPDVSLPKLEEELLKYWRDNQIFKRSTDPFAPTTDSETSKKKRPDYVFYDGPPFATGLPHYGHLLAGTIKDVVGRYFTMKGFHVDRRFGWDCHGVPVEFEIQKALNLQGAKAIREFGVGNFNEECRKIVLRYTQEWEKFVERSGRWVDFERQYRTMDLNFMESIWWAIKCLWDRGLIYEGLKSVPYSWAMNTPLSNFEANLNYKDVQDPAVTVRAPFVGDVKKKLGLKETLTYPIVAYVWTTTPWTLPSNLALAVGPDIEYSLVVNPAHQEVVVVASDVVSKIFPNLADEDMSETGPYVIKKIKGRELVGFEYTQFFPYFEEQRKKNAFRVYGGSFVTADEGTGIVHCASYGEEDVVLFQANGIDVVDPVDEDGNFTDRVSDFSGLHVKAADPKIIHHLKEIHKLVSHETIQHSYPFCWRTDTPLIYKPVSTWFVKVESFRDELLQMNSIIHWIPEHIRDGRFGKWLENARDWAISRNRFWGTPLPIWRCEGCEDVLCLGSVLDLEQRSGEKVTDLHSHRIDHLTFTCTKCKGTMKRIPEVLDCWFESGAMPYAQAHYPFEGKEIFEKNFPADFIAEGLDQTRGWFYTLLVLSTALFGRPAFKNVIVNGIVLAEDGKKMSKSLKNYPPPEEVMNEYGADAMRLYLLDSAATRAEDMRFSKVGVQQVVRQHLLPLWNAYNFFVTYARVDNWTPDKATKEAPTNLLDRWLLSKLASLVHEVDLALSSYHLYAATPAILDFVDQLTNWYIRLNRRRFWASGTSVEEQQDKLQAYQTLHSALLTFVRILAPLAPFITEEIFLNLSKGVAGMGFESVHFTSFPTVKELGNIEIDADLVSSMEIFEEVVLLGRSLRNDHGLKVRQPLSSLTVVHCREETLAGLRVFDNYIREELNVKEVIYTTEEERFVELSTQLNTKKLGKILGPKLGPAGMRKLQQSIQELSTEQIWQLEASGKTLMIEGVAIGLDDVIVTRKAKPGIKTSASSGRVTVVLDTHLTQELRLEGFAREFINRVQKLRKDNALDVQDRIIVHFMTACSHLTMAISEHREYVMKETLAVELSQVSKEAEILPTGTSTQIPALQEIGGKTVIISITPLQG